MPRPSNPIFSVDFSEMSKAELWEHFEKCMDQHDWFFEYSDDHVYWRLGTQERDYLSRLATKLGDNGHTRFAQRRPEGC